MKVMPFFLLGLFCLPIRAMEQCQFYDSSEEDNCYESTEDFKKRLFSSDLKNGLSSLEFFGRGGFHGRTIFNMVNREHLEIGDNNAHDAMCIERNGQNKRYFLSPQCFYNWASDAEGNSLVYCQDNTASMLKVIDFEKRRYEIFLSHETDEMFIGVALKKLIVFANINQVFVNTKEIKRDKILVSPDQKNPNDFNVVKTYKGLLFNRSGNAVGVKYTEEYAKALGIDQVEIIPLNN